MKKEKTIYELSQEFPEKTYKELERYRNEDRQQEAGVCVMGEMRKDREEDPTDKIKELEEALANSLAINESHQKMNGKLQERLTELEEENKKMHDHLNKKIEGARKAGL
jgi:tryptophanyl-tRNA synthetase